jgi:hypothetical protein
VGAFCASGKTAASASLMPFRPSVTAIRMSWHPRVLRSVKTFIQNFAPSVCSIQMPKMSRDPVVFCDALRVKIRDEAR